jgi:hypothetical protein
VFWVRADDVGAAAAQAVQVARIAGQCGLDVGPELYDVTVIPGDAVVTGSDPAAYPLMPD